jgi:hypothetical protein
MQHINMIEIAVIAGRDGRNAKRSQGSLLYDTIIS